MTQSQNQSDLFDALTEALLEKEYQVIDLLPRQVSAERGEAYAAAEDFFLESERLTAIYERFASLLVKLSCYYDICLYADGIWTENPAPEDLRERIAGSTEGDWCNLLLPREQALISFGNGDLYMTLYHPPENVAETVRQLAAAEGLFLRPGT